MLNKKLIIILAVDAAAIVAVFVFMWLYGLFLPRWVTWNDTQITADLNGDRKDETLELHKRRLEVQSGDETVYTTPFSWRVSDVFAQDLDSDGNKEIVMLVWKHGRAGDDPLPEGEKDSNAFSQHIIVYRYDGEKTSPVWTSSDIGSKVKEARFDKDNRLHLLDPDGEEIIWAWDKGRFLKADEIKEVPKTTGTPQKQEEGKDQAASETASVTPTPAVTPEPTEEPRVEDNEVHTLSLLAVGDNIAHEDILNYCYDPEQGYYDFTRLYPVVKDRISSYDLAIINQETVLIDDPSQASGYPMFATPNTMGDAIVDAGFDVVTTATNHSYDYGSAGIEQTVHYWKEHHPDIPLLGMYASEDVTVGEDGSLSHPTMWTVERNGIKMAMFNYTEETNGLSLEDGYLGNVCLLRDIDTLVNDLQQAEQTHDISICFIHIGVEYSTEPADYVRDYAALLADSGADIIICSHPHVTQGCETINTANGSTALVYWSLGNFAHNQHDPITFPGGAASIMIEKQPGQKAQVISHELLGTICHFQDGTRTMYFLDQYSEELAECHTVNVAYGTCFTLGSLYEKLYALQG